MSTDPEIGLNGELLGMCECVKQSIVLKLSD